MNQDKKNSIISLTKYAREAAGYKTQAAMAEALGIETGTYNKYETRSIIPNHLIPKFCELTGVTPTEFMAGEKFLHPGNPPLSDNSEEKRGFHKLQNSKNITSLPPTSRVPVYGYAAGSTDRVAINEGGIVGMRDRGNSLSYVQNGSFI